MDKPLNNRDNAADAKSAVRSATGETMAENNKPSVWKRHRMPIILGIIAVLLYLGSIVWMFYARG